jgi:multiple sugar transport system substrate-binding protein
MLKRLGIFAFLFLIFSCARPTGNKTIITWAVGKDITRTQQKLADDFMRLHPAVAVRIIEMPESSTTQRDSYVTYLIARDPTIDLYSIDITWAAEWAAADWIVPLDRYFPVADREDFLPGPLAGCSYHGHIYAVPWFTDAGLLYYRKDLLEKEGLAVPATWDDLVRSAKIVGQKYNMKGFVLQAAQYEGLVCNFLELLWSFGGTAADPAGRITVATPAALAALQFLSDCIYASRITPQDVLTFKEEESRQSFTSGESVFLRNWPYVWKVAQDTSTSQVAGRIGIGPLPGKAPGQGVSCLGGWNLAISKFSKHPDAAWQLAAFMTAVEAQKKYAIAGGRLPTRKSVYSDPAVLNVAPHFRTLYPVFINARPRPVSAIYSKVSDILQVELHRALTRQESPSDALQRAQEKIDEATKQ